MNNLNSIVIEGNLVSAPETHVISNAPSMCKLTIANNRFYVNRAGETVQETSYFTITAWGPTAEACSKYLDKGRGIRVVGRLKQDRWLDADGKNRDKIVIVAQHIEFKADKKPRNPKEGPSSMNLEDKSPEETQLIVDSLSDELEEEAEMPMNI